jgi:hypothetical protein
VRKILESIGNDCDSLVPERSISFNKTGTWDKVCQKLSATSGSVKGVHCGQQEVHLVKDLWTTGRYSSICSRIQFNCRIILEVDAKESVFSERNV